MRTQILLEIDTNFDKGLLKNNKFDLTDSIEKRFHWSLEEFFHELIEEDENDWMRDFVLDKVREEYDDLKAQDFSDLGNIVIGVRTIECGVDPKKRDNDDI